MRGIIPTAGCCILEHCAKYTDGIICSGLLVIVFNFWFCLYVSTHKAMFCVYVVIFAIVHNTCELCHVSKHFCSLCHTAL